MCFVQCLSLPAPLYVDMHKAIFVLELLELKLYILSTKEIMLLSFE